MGKHVDFSACTVITGDLNLELDEVSVPKTIAINLTFSLFWLCLIYIFFSVPQSEETRAKLSQIAWVPQQVSFL